MTTPDIAQPAATEIALEASGIAGALWLLGAAVLGMVLIYVIGLDQGMTSVLGKNMYIHEFVHDGRHFLGFPCH